jgi:ribonuclease Z
VPDAASRELVVLGTASQVPTRRRNHNAFYLRLDDQAILVDPGEGTQRQLTLAQRSVASLTALCITHFHGDHCLGLPGVLARRALDTGHRPLDVWFPAEGGVYYERLVTSTATAMALPGRPRPVDTEGQVGSLGRFRLIARRLDHLVPTLGWRLEEPARLHLLPDRLAEFGLEGPSIGAALRAGGVQASAGWVPVADLGVVRPGVSVAFVLDTRLCDAAYDLAAGVDLLVAESTFRAGEEAMAQAWGHLTSVQAARLAAEAGARQLVLTHFSSRHPDERLLAAEAAEHFPAVVAAADLTVIPVPSGTSEHAA